METSFLKENNILFIISLSEAIQSYTLKTIPTLVVIDECGRSQNGINKKENFSPSGSWFSPNNLIS